MNLKQYRQRTYTDANGNLISDRYTFYQATDSREIILDEDLSLDEISYQNYGTPLYYWIIGEANNISDPFIKLKKGLSIKVPVL